jgi:hypothetical protein
MLLGQVLQRLDDETFAAETLLALGNLPLVAEVEAARRQFGESPGEYAVGALRRFASFASDDHWLGLMTALERADDAGAACLRHMLEWSLRHETTESDAGCCGSHCTCEGS